MAASKPTITVFGNSFADNKGSNISQEMPKGDIITSGLHNIDLQETIELTNFEKTVKTFILGRLGYPVIKVELADLQIKIAVDEAVSRLNYHAPLWMTQLLVFEASSGQNVYELPRYILDNLTYVGYKKTLLTALSQAGTLEFDFFIRYFQDNFLFSDFNVGEFLLMQMHLEQIRKILSNEGTWSVLDNQYLIIFPMPTAAIEPVIVEYRAMNSETLHPAFKHWICRYALACGKDMLGQIRGKYKVLPSPGGGAQLNGMELVEQSKVEKEELITELLEDIEEQPQFTLF